MLAGMTVRLISKIVETRSRGDWVHSAATQHVIVDVLK
jgi:hypothetical protein